MSLLLSVAHRPFLLVQEAKAFPEQLLHMLPAIHHKPAMAAAQAFLAFSALQCLFGPEQTGEPGPGSGKQDAELLA